MHHSPFLTSALVMTMACASLTQAATATHPATGENVIALESQAVRVSIEPSGTRFEIRDGAGQVIAPMHAESGVRFAAPGEEELSVANIKSIIRRDATSLSVRLKNDSGSEIDARFTLTNNTFRIEAVGKAGSEYIIDVRTAPLGPVYGLGDHGGYGRSTNLFGFSDEAFINRNNGYRFVSSFAIFPKQGLGQVVFENGLKRVVINRSENKMGVAKTHRLNAYYFTGDPHAIYQAYKEARTQEGYLDFQPKFRFFELGYEAFGSLGWNTFQTSVEKDLDGYLERGYPLRWAVVGSGFWRGQRRHPKEGATTSFGLWDTEAQAGRRDAFPNPRYPDIDGFKNFFKERDLPLIIGLRINFKARAEDGGHYHPPHDGPFTAEALERGYFIADAAGKPETWRVNFPQGPVHLLDGDNPDAVQWYVENYKKWGADGAKEDLMFMEGARLNNDAKLNRVNEALMAEGQYIMARNAAFSVAGDILRLEDTKHGFNQDRPVINLLAYAASGYSNAYPDIVAGKYIDPPLTDDQKIYFVRNAMFSAVTPTMSFGLGPWHLEEAQEAIVKKAADLHNMLVPYTYSEVVRNFQTGYPHALTPLPIAFPDDPNTYDLANRQQRQYSWMIGRSLLATPLYGEDYATASTRDVYLPAGNWMDWDTGEVLVGGQTYSDYPLPPEKIPLFVGGDGIFVLRKGGELFAYYFPLNEGSLEYTFTFPDGKSTSTIVTPATTQGDFTVNAADGAPVDIKRVPHRNGYFFPIEPGKRYAIRASGE